MARLEAQMKFSGLCLSFSILSWLCLALLLYAVGLILSQDLSVWKARQPWESGYKRTRHTLSPGVHILNLLTGLWLFVGYMPMS